MMKRGKKMKKWKQSLKSTMVFFLFASGMGVGATIFPINVKAEDLVNGQEATLAAENVSVKGNQIPIQILGINDFHGALSTTGSFYTDAGVKVEKAGSAALLSSYLNRAEKTFAENNIGGQTIRVHSGDMVGASPANSALLQDEPTVNVLNQMNFTIGTLGNHEFDEGLGEFNRIMTAGAPTKDPYGILASYPREASKAEIVIGNVVKKGTKDIPYGWQPYTIKEFGEGEQKVKIGFIGVVTTEIPNLVLREHYEGYDFLDEATTIAKYSKALREEQGVNAIVVLAHIPAVSKQQQVSGDAAEILAKVNTLDPDNSVDALFAGHNHQYTNGVVNKTRVVQSTSQGKGYVDLQGKIDVATKDFVETPTAEVLPVSPVNAPAPDGNVGTIVKDADDRVISVTSKKIGISKENGNISREVNEFKESALGNLITDGQIAMAKAKGINVDFAMTNNGGVRADLLVNENREITWGAAQAVQPFGNIMQIVEMTGAQIEQVLNEQYDQEEKYFLQLSGLAYTFIENADAAQPFKVVEMKKTDGSPILKDQKYRVVINDFLFGGGDGFSGFVGAKLIDAMQPDTETFINYIESKTAKGEEITAKIEGRKAKYTEETGGSTTEINEGEELIKKATTFDPLYVGNEYLTGVTIPNGKLSVIKETTENSSVKAVATEEPVVEQAANDGKFKLNIRSFDLKEGEKLVVTITDSNQNSVTFPVTVLKAVSESSSTTQTTIQTSSSSKDKNKLPKTGESNQGIAYFGIVLIASTFVVWEFKKNKVIK